jgi:ATP-dependent protease HslVU (ClpYQ) peptidase subunit
MTKLLSVNSYIEAARAGAAGAGFLIIAKEIGSMSDRSEAINQKNVENLAQTNEHINAIAGMHIADMAFDLIDKVDRNLSERNSDIQAWATFESVKEFLEHPNDKSRERVTVLLKNLCKMYIVYSDLILANKEGVICAVSNSEQLLGSDVSGRPWFKAVKTSMNTIVSDLYYSDIFEKYVINFATPVVDENGVFLGVLSSRFNWEYIYDILDKTKVGATTDVFIVNSNGDVIAAKNRDDVFKLHIKNNPAVKTIISRELDYGYHINQLSDGKVKNITGFAITKGYNNYAGKGWAGIVIENF